MGEMAQKYRIIRTETIQYVKDFTGRELVEMGLDPAALTDGDLSADFTDQLSLSSGNVLRDNLTEATERAGDVQGNDFRLVRLNPDLESEEQ